MSRNPKRARSKMLIIEGPVITEKSLTLATQGTYSFAVNRSANRIQVAQAVQSLYGVTVTDVRIQIQKGKIVRRRTGLAQQKSWKKALVQVKAGQSIKDFELKEEKPAETPEKTEKTDKQDKKTGKE